MNRALKVDDAISSLLIELSNRIEWKYLKSSRCLKKVIGDLVLQLNLYSSKWNQYNEHIEIQLEFNIWSKRYDKKMTVHSFVASYRIEPGKSNWWEITYEDDLNNVIEKLHVEISNHILSLSDALEKDLKKAAIFLSKVENFEKYKVRIRFIDDYAGRNYSGSIAKHYIDSLPPLAKDDIRRYKDGEIDCPWVNNSPNVKFIVDNNLLEIEEKF